MATEEERASIERRLKTHRSNLASLLEKKAKFGALETPIWLENQIAEEQANIALYEPLVPSSKAQAVVQNVSGGIDLTTLFVQGTQLNAQIMLQAEQNKQIIEQQARDALWRMQAKEVIDEVVAQVHASEQARKDGAGWYRRVLLVALGMSILALIVSCAAFTMVAR